MASALIGREHPLRVLGEAVDRAFEDRGSLVLVAGEAGIGKTALLAHTMEEADRRGAVVLSGTCWEPEGAPGYWPWVQAVRRLRRILPPKEWDAARSAAGEGLDILLGEASGRPVHQVAPGGAFRVYDAVMTLLAAAARSHPLVIAIDDLHRADTASVKLLEFLVRHIWFEPMLLVGAYRDVEAEAPGHPLRPLLAPLTARATTVTLTGLSPGGVRALITDAAGREPDDPLVEEVYRRTGGNPLFVEQTARLWRSGSPPEAIPAGVREVIERRISHLPDAVAASLSAASVLGQEFDRRILATAAALPLPQVNLLLHEAAAARLVTPLGDGRFAFAHGLVRESLYQALSSSEQRTHHATVVRVHEDRLRTGARLATADLANHAYLAVPEIEPKEAREHLLTAAREADDRLAFEEAVGHYHRALELTPAAEPRTRIDLLLRLASEQQRAGDLHEARRTATEAVEAARVLGDAELLADAVLGLYGPTYLGDDDRLALDLLDEARTGLTAAGTPPSDAAAVRLLAASGLVRAYNGRDEEAREMTARAVDLARETDDPDVLCSCLLAAHESMWGPDTASRRAGLAAEMAVVARRAGALEMELRASSLRVWDLLELGDPRAFDELASFVAAAERSRLPRFRFEALSHQGAVSALTGDFERAGDLVDLARELGEQIGEVGDADLWRQQRWALELQRGRIDEAEAVLRSGAGPEHPYRSLLDAITHIRRGEVASAVRYAAEADKSAIARWFMPLWLRFQAELAAVSGDADHCERARSAIAPYTGQWVVVGGATLDGPVVYWAALIDAAQQRWDEAAERFEAARAAADRLRARPWALEARVRLAEVLKARGGPGDAHTAAQLLDHVEREAEEIGMGRVLERAADLRDQAPTEANGTPPRAADEGVFRREGGVWAIGYRGHTVHVPDMKGLHDLHVLIGLPYRDVRAVDLVAPAEGGEVAAAGSMGSDDVLDDRARAAYRERLARLEEEAQRAHELQDDRRAAEIDRERDILIDELRAASGLGGRARRLGDEGERVRKTVTARIRHALRRLETLHPEAAAHLRASVSTGITCSYAPREQPVWAL